MFNKVKKYFSEEEKSIRKEMTEASLYLDERRFDKIKYCRKCEKPHLSSYKLCPVCKSYMDKLTINKDNKYVFSPDDPFETLKQEETDRRYCKDCRKWFPKQYCQCPVCGKDTLDYPEATEIIEKERAIAIKELEESIARHKREESYMVHCPYCNSTNVKRISTTSKVTSVAMLGIASNKIGKQWHCNNCKSDF